MRTSTVTTILAVSGLAISAPPASPDETPALRTPTINIPVPISHDKEALHMITSEDYLEELSEEDSENNGFGREMGPGPVIPDQDGDDQLQTLDVELPLCKGSGSCRPVSTMNSEATQNGTELGSAVNATGSMVNVTGIYGPINVTITQNATGGHGALNATGHYHMPNLTLGGLWQNATTGSVLVNTTGVYQMHGNLTAGVVNGTNATRGHNITGYFGVHRFRAADHVLDME